MVFPAFSGALRKLYGGPCRGTRGDSDQNAFVFANQLAGRESVLIGYGNDFVVYLGIQHVGNEARTDSLNFVRTGDSRGEHGRGSGLHGDDLDIRVLG